MRLEKRSHSTFAATNGFRKSKKQFAAQTLARSLIKVNAAFAKDLCPENRKIHSPWPRPSEKTSGRSVIDCFVTSFGLERPRWKSSNRQQPRTVWVRDRRVGRFRQRALSHRRFHVNYPDGGWRAILGYIHHSASSGRLIQGQRRDIGPVGVEAFEGPGGATF
jgi:hypothetical protein